MKYENMGYGYGYETCLCASLAFPSMNPGEQTYEYRVCVCAYVVRHVSPPPPFLKTLTTRSPASPVPGKYREERVAAAGRYRNAFGIATLLQR